jgi:hypothetical protein
MRIVVDSPQGLPILLGEVPPPQSEEVIEMLNACRPPSSPTLDSTGQPLRVDGGQDFTEPELFINTVEKFEGVIERAGGWKKINAVTKEWTRNFPTKWNILVDAVVWARLSPSRLDGSMIDKISSKYGVTRKVIGEIVQIFPQEISTAILNWPGKNAKISPK